MKPKCKLCKKNELDNTGAHFITESLVRSAVSADNTIGRDNEIMYSLSTESIGNIFIGRKIDETKVKELKGRELTDQEIEENKNMLVDYNLVCRNCENKFNPIETYFITDILRNKIEKQTEGKEVELFEFDSKVTLLFLIINLWRTSTSKKTKFKIDDGIEEDLRIVINSITQNKIVEIIENLNYQEGILSNIKIATYYLEHYSGKKSANQISLTSETIPISLILNQIAFLVFFEFTFKFKRPANLSDLTSKKDIIALTKFQPNKIKIRIINDLRRKKLFQSIGNYQIKTFKDQMISVIKLLHYEMYGFDPHHDLIRATKLEISELPINELNILSINKIIAKNLIVCGEYYSQYGVK
jgi:hypothetical protein